MVAERQVERGGGVEEHVFPFMGKERDLSECMSERDSGRDIAKLMFERALKLERR